MDYEQQTDQGLMELIRDSRQAAFDALRERYEVALRRHLLRTLRDTDAAEDVLQEALLRLWTRAGQWDSERGTVKGWLFRIATNLALNHIRSVGRRKETPLALKPRSEDDEETSVPGWMIDSVTPSPEAALESVERKRLLRELVDGLPEEKREVLELVYEGEMKIRETADALGIPEGTVKSRLHHATRLLAREWGALTDE